MEKQIFELSKHGKGLRIHIENMSKLDVMNLLSNFLESLIDEEILDEEDILMCLLAGTDAKKMTDAMVKALQRLRSEEMKGGDEGWRQTIQLRSHEAWQPPHWRWGLPV